ncbi:MAG: hypothetical protein OSB19_16270 [Opitutaceae bacterium]|nr:hypothetical protein [Opitutaceae bacterium]
MRAFKAKFPMLVVDTASRRVCVALIETPEADTATKFSNEEASLSLFPTIKSLLEERSMKLAQLRSIAFCEGPGSMLGIRTAIMGIRAWIATGQLEDCKLYSFNSLQIGKHVIANTSDAPDSYLVVTDARRQSWNCLNSLNLDGNAVELIQNEALEQATQPVYSFDEFPIWTKTQANIIRLFYRPEDVFQSLAFLGLLRQNPDTEPLNTRTLEFAKWIPKARTADQIES